MKHKVALIMSTITLAVSGLTGCGRKRTVIDPAIKNSFQQTEEKVDEYNGVFSVSTHNVEETLQVNKQAPTIKQAPDTSGTNTRISEAKLYEFLAAEFFGVYVYSCVNYCLQNKYEENGLLFNDIIYDNVTNMIDPYGREALAKYKATNKFFYQMGQDDNDLTFICDWDLAPSAKELADNQSFKGIIYVNGRIFRDDNLNITGFRLTSFKAANDVARSVLTAINFDFVNKKLYIIDNNTYDDTGDGSGNKDFIDKFNAGELDYETLMSFRNERVLVGSANLTDDYRDVDYEGYFLSSFAEAGEEYVIGKGDVSEETYKEKYEEVYSNLYDFKVRIQGDDIDRSEAIKISFLEDSLAFGVAKSRIYVDPNNQVDYVFIEKDKLIGEIDKYIETHEGEDTIPLLGKLKDEIEDIRDDKYLTYFSNKTYEFDANSAAYYRHTTYTSTDFYYRFVNKKDNSKLIIRTFDGEITSVKLEEPHGKGNDKYFSPQSTRSDTKVTYEDADHGYVIATKTVTDYAYCSDCKKEYVWKIEENKYLGKIEDRDHLDLACYTVKSYPEFDRIDDDFYGFIISKKEYRYNYEVFEMINVINEARSYKYLDEYGVYIPTTILRKSMDSIYYDVTDYFRTNIDGAYEYEFIEEDDTTTVKWSLAQTIDDPMWRERFEEATKVFDGEITVKRNEKYNYDIEVSYNRKAGSTENDKNDTEVDMKMSFHLEYGEIEDREIPYLSKYTLNIKSSGNLGYSYDITGNMARNYLYSTERNDFFEYTELSHIVANGKEYNVHEKDSVYGDFKVEKLETLPYYVSIHIGTDYQFHDALINKVVKMVIEKDVYASTSI